MRRLHNMKGKIRGTCCHSFGKIGFGVTEGKSRRRTVDITPFKIARKFARYRLLDWRVLLCCACVCVRECLSGCRRWLLS